MAEKISHPQDEVEISVISTKKDDVSFVAIAKCLNLHFFYTNLEMVQCSGSEILTVKKLKQTVKYADME